MTSQIENLIFSGGGVKGIGYGSALAVLDSLGVLNNIKGLAGTSIGAFVASLLSVGYSGAEIRESMLNEYTYEKMIGEMSPVRMLLSTSAYGMNDGNQILKTIREKIEAKTGSKKFTFSQLYERFGKVLKIFVTNLNLGTCQELNYETEPDMEIALAVRASISMPIIFDPVLYKGDFLVDGGMLNNFPKNAFPPENSVGFIFVQHLSDENGSEPSREPIQNRIDFLSQILICTMRDSKSHFRDVAGLEICEIETGHTSSRDFLLTYDERMQLDWLGYKSVCLWLEKLGNKQI